MNRVNTYEAHHERESRRARRFFAGYEPQRPPLVDPRGGDRCVLDEGRRTCRYCGRGEATGATFQKRAHLIPELLGNRSIVSEAECDDCNDRFSGYERHLKHFLGPSRTLVGVQGKRRRGIRVRPYENLETGSSIIFQENQHHIVADLHLKHDSVMLDDEKRRGQFKTVIEPYVPVKVWKALIQIGVGLVDWAELDAYRWLRQVVSTDLHDEHLRAAPPGLCRLYWFSLPGAGVLFDPLSVEIYRRTADPAKNEDGEQVWLPSKVLVLKFGRFIFQLFLFADEDMACLDGRSISFLPYPVLLSRECFERFGDVESSDHHLCSPDPVEDERRTIEFGWHGLRRPITADERAALGLPPESSEARNLADDLFAGSRRSDEQG